MFFPNSDPLSIVLILAAVVIAATFHEYAHAFVADRLGDPTPRNLGRLTLNPLAHLDVVGTLFFVVFGFGWARPVPVNPRNFDNPRLGMLQVALAGPLANVTMAFLLGGLLRATAVSDTSLAGPFILVVIQINIILALFNLIPIPPLDGSRILESLLPASQAIAFSRLQPYGTLVLLVLLYTGMVGRVMRPAIVWLYLASTRGIGRP